MDSIKKNSILIVDDVKLNLKILTHILQPDYTVYTAKDGFAAIEMAEEYLPDIILLDIIMPEMDGYDVLTALKTSDKTQSIPVIFITALTNAEDEEKGLALGTADYIFKPFNPGIVKLRVRNQLQILNQIRLIERLSMMDHLTEIPNRRSFDQRLRLEWGRAIRESSSISMMMIDVDRFKLYNDTYGHLQGDAALQMVAKTITQTLKRSTDLVARWGGEEFVVVLPNTELDGALYVAEEIRTNIENALIPCLDGRGTKVTVSLGVHSHVPNVNSSIDKFISKADHALYAAKETGRNRVCQSAAETTIQKP